MKRIFWIVILLAAACDQDLYIDQPLHQGDTESATWDGVVEPEDTGWGDTGVQPDTGAGVDTGSENDTGSDIDTGRFEDTETQWVDTGTGTGWPVDTDTETIEPGVECVLDYCLGVEDSCWLQRCTMEACVDEIVHKNLEISNWCQHNINRLCKDWDSEGYSNDVAFLLPGVEEMDRKCSASTLPNTYIQVRGFVRVGQCVVVRVHGEGRYVGRLGNDGPPRTCRMFYEQGQNYQVVVDRNHNEPGWVDIQVADNCGDLDDC